MTSQGGTKWRQGLSDKRAFIIDGKSPLLCHPELAKELFLNPSTNRKPGSFAGSEWQRDLGKTKRVKSGGFVRNGPSLAI
jgi:hypothetical protein